MNILSIQSHVAYGHVGNASAAFPLQRLGHEVWAVNTVQFSNHTGYGAWRGEVFSAAAIREVVEGIQDRGVFPKCDGVLSGYMGEAAIGEAILDAVARAKRANAGALYCCDPVIGDVGRGVFVRPGVPEFMRDRALPAADVVTPNQFELEFLTGARVEDFRAAMAAARSLLDRGPRVALVTSLITPETPADVIDMLVVSEDGAWSLRTPLLPVSVNGAGDAIAALFFAHYLETRSPAEALSKAASSVYGVLKATAEAGSREILTVAAQQEFVSPSRRFEASPL
ncbi:pyridoxal kinase PdxY [Methylopila sp. M107]|uniref:pyridoxal kinase PdxY n=1 Tax=Methylopila sp. M107 TaxID=1101190 RepID=UPI000374D79F|nr:pyridoxal kinase PdxY [Methylopila sp. M107]